MTTLSLEAPRRRQGGRVLAIEADARRACALRGLFRRRDGIDLTIAASIDEATTSIDDHVPDVVLTSPFLPPPDAERLTAHLKAIPGASHVQVLITPEFPDADGGTVEDRRGRLFARRHPAPVTACNQAAVLEQIDNYLEQARAAIADPSTGGAHAFAIPPDGSRPTMRLVHVRAGRGGDPVSDILTRVDQLAGPKGRDRRRAVRRPGAELPWLWSAKLPSGLDLKVVDVSNGGVLVETATKLSLGSTVDLCILGHGTNLSVLARITRTEVAHVDSRGVKYHIGAAFARDLDLVEAAERVQDATPGVLAGLLSRVLAQADRGSTAALLCFEQELARLVPVRCVQVRRAPVPSAEGTEAVYFAVPGAGSILQATFDRDRAPSPLEFKLLKAAANLAAVVLEFAPPRAENQYRIAARG